MPTKSASTKSSKSRAKSGAARRGGSARKSGASAKPSRIHQEEFVRSVKSFASVASKEFREELDSLVARAQRTGSKFAETASHAAKAADGRVVELTGSTTREGLNAVRRAAGEWFEGLAKAIAPKEAKSAPAKKSAGKTAKRGASSIAQVTEAGTRSPV